MRTRLERLGVAGVEARTFHSAALSQLRRARGDAPGRILATKALLLRQVGNTLPPPYRFRPAGDLATEVEWAKNRRLTPERYREGLGEHEPPIPADLMARVFRDYERRKASSGLVDFEALLELSVRMYEEDEWALAATRERYRCFTVDEYQDVNLLQQVDVLVLVDGEAPVALARSRQRPLVLLVHAHAQLEQGLEVDEPGRGLAPLVVAEDARHQVGRNRRLVLAEALPVALGREPPV